MEFMTLKQYAESKNVSYEAVRKQVIKYKKELADHIIRKDGVQYLDQDAIAFLSEKRRHSPLVIVHEENTDRIKELEAEVESLRAKLMTAQDEIMNTQRKLIETQETAKDAIEAKTRYSLLLEDHQHTKEELDQVKTERDQIKNERDQIVTERDQMKEKLTMTEHKLKLAEIDKEAAQKEAGSYQRSWFGFYRKVE